MFQLDIVSWGKKTYAHTKKRSKIKLRKVGKDFFFWYFALLFVLRCHLSFGETDGKEEEGHISGKDTSDRSQEA